MNIILIIIISFIFSVITAFLLIPYLKEKHVNQRLSIYLEDKHRSKKNTPTFGGLIFILPTLFIMFFLVITNKTELDYNLAILIFTFIGYSIIGFIDDYLIIKNNNNKGLSISSKFILQILIALVFFYMFMKAGNEPLIWIHSLNIKENIGFLYGILILFILVASSNAVNITDGLDGLAAGLCVISFSVFGIISLNTDWLINYISISIFSFIIVGTLLGFLIFNKNPAKIFMGDTGSLALGATLGAFSIITRHEILLIIIGLVFVVETLSCIIQIIYFKITGKRLFPITPIHHTFERILDEKKVVYIFYFFGIISGIISLIYGIIL